MTKKIFTVNRHWQGKDEFSPMEFHRVYQPHLRVGPILRSSWPIQRELCGFYLFVWASHILLVRGLFLFFIWFFLLVLRGMIICFNFNFFLRKYEVVR